MGSSDGAMVCCGANNQDYNRDNEGADFSSDSSARKHYAKRNPQRGYKQPRSNIKSNTCKGARISTRAHLWFLGKVRSRLSPHNMAEMQESCFGQLFGIPDMQFQGQLFYHLLLCLQSSFRDSGILVFKINGKLVEFGPIQFGQMTGLNFNEATPPPTSSEAHYSFFKGQRKIVVREIYELFKSECKKSGGGSPGSLQLAHLYVLYSILLIKDLTTKGIDMHYFHLIDDKKTFKNFHWGRVAYDFLVSSMYNARDNIIRRKENNEPLTCEIHGFVYALQTWAYEVIPGLGDYTGYRVLNTEHSMPRMVRWNSAYPFRFEDLGARFFRPSSGIEPVPIVPSEDELEYLAGLGLPNARDGYCILPEEVPVRKRNRKLGYETCIDDDENEGPNKKGRKDTTEKKGEKKLGRRSGLRRSGAVGGESSSQSALNQNSSPDEDAREHASDINDSFMNEIQRRLDALEAANTKRMDALEATNTKRMDALEAANMKRMEAFESNIQEMKELIMQILYKVGEGHRGKETNVPDDESCSINKCLEERVAEMHTKNIPAQIQSSPHICSQPQPGICTEQPSIMPLSSPRLAIKQISPGREKSVKKNETIALKQTTAPLAKAMKEDETAPPSKSTKKPPVPPSRAQKRQSCARTSLKKSKHETIDSDFEPSDIDFYFSEMSAFNAWKKAHYDGKARPPIIHLPSRQLVTADWFTPLQERKGWLREDHIDALLCLMLYKYNRDVSIEAKLKRDWTIIEHWATDALAKSDWGNTLKYLTSYVNGIRPYIDGIPWTKVNRVLGVANVNKDHWVAYEINFEEQSITVYDSKTYSWKLVAPPFEAMCRNIPSLFRHFGLWEKMDMIDRLKNKWDLFRYDDAPQQDGASDCGVISVKVVECLAYGVSPDKLDTLRGGLFRHRYCAQLYAYGLETVPR